MAENTHRIDALAVLTKHRLQERQRAYNSDAIAQHVSAADVQAND
jgi:hypothetical protein